MDWIILNPGYKTGHWGMVDPIALLRSPASPFPMPGHSDLTAFILGHTLSKSRIKCRWSWKNFQRPQVGYECGENDAINRSCLGMVYTPYLPWNWEWFIIVLPTWLALTTTMGDLGGAQRSTLESSKMKDFNMQPGVWIKCGFDQTVVQGIPYL